MWKRLHALGVVCVQEHNLPRNKEAQLTKTAKARGYTLIITFGGADDDTSERKGVLMMICDEVAEIKKTHYAMPGFIRAEVQWGTKTIDVGCVYAPAQLALHVLPGCTRDLRDVHHKAHDRRYLFDPFGDPRRPQQSFRACPNEIFRVHAECRQNALGGKPCETEGRDGARFARSDNPNHTEKGTRRANDD